MKKLVCLFIAALLMLTLSVSAFAAGGDKAPENPVSFEDQIIALLQECTQGQRLTIINKAVASDADMSKIEHYMTEEEIQLAHTMSNSLLNATPRFMPILCVPSIMQLEDDWCGATTAQIILMFMNGTAPEQSSIVESITDSPSIDAVTVYVNNRITSTGKKYTYKSFNTSDDSFMQTVATRLSTAVNDSRPMIIQVANPLGSNYWRYKTDGHYCLCDGLATEGYHIVDPYYYSYHKVKIKSGDTEGYFCAKSDEIKSAISTWGSLHSNVAYTSY